MLFGLFCSGHFSFGSEDRRKIEETAGFKWEDVKRVNLKEALLITLQNGETRKVPLTDVEFMKRPACKFCEDYSSEFADISFGGIGAPDGWTSVVLRTPKGRALFADARRKCIEEFPFEEDPVLMDKVTAVVEECSKVKRQRGKEAGAKLGGNS
jgi:coenzyme F420 hydrogenase subunit beta